MTETPTREALETKSKAQLIDIAEKIGIPLELPPRPSHGQIMDAMLTGLGTNREAMVKLANDMGIGDGAVSQDQEVLDASQRLAAFLHTEGEPMVIAIEDELPDEGELAPDIAVRIIRRAIPKGDVPPPQALALALFEALPMLGSNEFEADATHATDAEGYLWTVAADHRRQCVRLSRARNRWSSLTDEETAAHAAACKTARRRLAMEKRERGEFKDGMTEQEVEDSVHGDDVLASPEVKEVMATFKKRSDNFVMWLDRIAASDYTMVPDPEMA